MIVPSDFICDVYFSVCNGDELMAMNSCKATLFLIAIKINRQPNSPNRLQFLYYHKMGAKIDIFLIRMPSKKPSAQNERLQS